MRFACVVLGAILGPLLAAVDAGAQSPGTGEAQVDFRSDILPLLSDRCFACHGPDADARQAELRLDQRGKAAGVAFQAGRPDQSQMIARMASEDDGFRMPPPGSGKEPLNRRQVEKFRQWIAQGAEYKKHWSFEKPTRPELPSVEHANWVRNPIDRFVLARLEAKGIDPSPPAAPARLARRASLSLTGLPLDRDLAASFLSNPSEETYRAYVDELLASPHYGERMAYVWMDAARYSDTDGFQIDAERENWPWRDWVIRSYNANKPFDRFTIEQTAGDLLPEATTQQILATCFHRNHMTNGEGGRDPEESRVDYVIDRVNTMGKVWLGLTLQCCQCHSHKFDPITQREYYQLYGFFNSIDEDGRAGKNAKPYLEIRPQSIDIERVVAKHRAEVERLRRAHDAKIAELKKGFGAWLARQKRTVSERIARAEGADWETLEIVQAETRNIAASSITIESDNTLQIGRYAPDQDRYTLLAKLNHARVGALRLQVFPQGGNTFGGLSKSNSGNFVLTGFKVFRIRGGESTPIDIESGWADYHQQGLPIDKAFDGKRASGWGVWTDLIDRPRTAVFRLDPVQIRKGDRLKIVIEHFSEHPQHCMRRFRLSASPRKMAEHPLPKSFHDLANSPIEQLDESTRSALLTYYLDHHPQRGPVGAQLKMAKARMKRAGENASVNVMVLREREQARKTHVLVRGEFDQYGEEVEPGFPEVIGPLGVDSSPGRTLNRLDLAKWLVSDANPLTARVTVNRYWQMHFGHGLVRTPQDFGVQGELPTHPKLLDWLAVEFMESGWDIKHIQRLIVTSQTYRQQSKHREELLEIDPDNRLLARGPRYRLPAAIIRDCALAASGLLVPKIGGEPVKPYQPEGVWFDANQGRYRYERDTGSSLYRRSLYTFWRRNAMPPAMFDAATRRVCQVRVTRTNSPMHALNLMNDTTYVEAARALAQKTMKRHKSVDEQIEQAARAVLAEGVTAAQREMLIDRYREFLKRFQADRSAADQLLAHGDWPVDEQLDPARLAALTLCCSVLLNLDEAITLE